MNSAAIIQRTFYPTFNARRINKIKNLRDKYHVRYGLHSASYVNSAEIEPTVRKGVEKYLLGYVELAKQLEAEYLVLHFGYHFSLFHGGGVRQPDQDIHPVVELAEKYNIPIGIENMNKVHEDCEIVYLGVTIEELARVFNALPTKYFGIDPGRGPCEPSPGRDRVLHQSLSGQDREHPYQRQ